MNKESNNTMKKFLTVIATILFSLTFSGIFKWSQDGSPWGPSTFLYAGLLFLNIWILGFIGFKILNRFSGYTAGNLKHQVILAFALFAVVSLVVCLVLIACGVYIFYLLNGYDTTNFLEHLITVEFVGALKQYAIWILISASFFFYLIYLKAVERETSLRTENLKYQYNNLKAHINPHFLFNSLNTISQLAYIDAERTEMYIQKLSAMYRYIIEKEDIDLVLLPDELSFVCSYFDLQKVRDENKIFLEITVEHPENFQVVPVSLQILVENALKHNVASEEKPLHIKIHLSDKYLIVQNNLQKKSTLPVSHKTGLPNLMERVKLITKNHVIVNEEPDKFIVKLPVVGVSR